MLTTRLTRAPISLLNPIMTIAANQNTNRLSYIFPGRKEPVVYEYDRDFYFVVPRVGEIVIGDNDDGVPILEWEVAKITHQTSITDVNGIVNDIRVYLKKPVK